MNEEYFIGEIINNVLVIPFDESHNTYEEIVFCFDDIHIVIKIDADYDELILNYEKEIDRIDRVYIEPIWSKSIIGKKVVGYWISKNQQNYFDVFALGLDEFIPSLIITSIASKLEVGFVNYYNKDASL